MKKAGDLSLDIYSVAGKKIESKHLPFIVEGLHWVNVTNGERNIGNGTYILVIRSAGEIVTEKFAVFKQEFKCTCLKALSFRLHAGCLFCFGQR